MNPLVECVPNFSEGRRPEVVEAIADAVRSTPGVNLLDYSSDHDHNRSVLTFVGSPEGIEEAAFQAIKTAAELIDMTQQSGEHPRIGATDVVPFIPIRDVTMDDCIAIANRLGQRVGEELGVPVYLYEKAARQPTRTNLENIRRGEYEGLREAIKADPDRAPDFGPAELGTAGATVIGARPFLIAYNVYLNTDDVAAAKKIARAIRHSGGGLRFTKALGLLVDGKAQVSMNLTDFSLTPIHRVQELIKVEAARYGYQITHAELIGLIPEQALVDTARWYLQLDLFDENQQILDWKVRAAEASDITPSAFLDAVAAGTPAPGGGSVAALAGALASALAGMVARLSMGKKKYADIAEEMQQAADTVDKLRLSLTSAIAEDSAAFEKVMDSYRMDKSDPGRAGAIQAAMTHAAEVPLETVKRSLQTMEQLKIVAALGNVNAATDAAVGAQMALSAVEGAALNVLINLQDLKDETIVNAFREEVINLREAGRALAAEIMALVEERIGLA